MKKLQSEMSSKKETNQSLIKLFKVISLLEGLSYILLLFVGVPLKYLAGNAFLVKSLGMPHGILFVAYVVIALFIRSRMKWDFKDTFVVLIASLLPFGTFYINRKYL
jgi:integral membrane protein